MIDEEIVQEVHEEAPQEVQQEHEQQEAPPAPERPNDKNIRQLRENAEKAAKERDEAYRMLEEMRASQQPQPAPQEEDDFNLPDDDFLEGKHLKQYHKKYFAEVKKLKEELKNYQQQTVQTTTEVKLKTQYPDFDKVVNTDTINRLREKYPDIAQSLSHNPDTYSKATSAYTLIKQLGLYTEDTFSEDRERAQGNAAKPRPSVSLNPQQGDSPLSHANAFAKGLTPDLKEQLYKEMLESSRRS